MKIWEIFEKKIGVATEGGCMLVHYENSIIPLIDYEKVDWDVQVHGNTKILFLPMFCC